MIARDEQRCIERALASVAPFVDEMIVLDTGSVDATPRIARGAGARVSEWEWQEDFAAARNAALDLSGADFNMILDADEWLVEGGASLRRPLKTNPPRVGLVDVASASTADGVDVTTTTLSERLLPAGVRYVGAVHEQPEHDLQVVRLPVVIGHDGYEQAQQQRKAGRNERLLRAELQRRPLDAYLHYQLAKELQAGERWTESARLYLFAIGLAGTDVPWRHSLVVRALSVLGKAGLFSDALAVFDTEQGQWGHSPDFWFAAGNLFLDTALADPGSASELLPLVEACWLRCLDIGEQPDLEGSVAGRGSHLAARNLAGLYETTGDEGRARHYRQLAVAR